MADDKVIFTMTGVTKSFEKKPVFRDISLSYYYGAKIGVLGLNGSGKSTLLKIMAGEDKEFDGAISQVPGYTLGYLAQEPRPGLRDAGRRPDEGAPRGIRRDVRQGLGDR
jgi:ATPase subunit of ABC transporter with duplicated ATPase domains